MKRQPLSNKKEHTWRQHQGDFPLHDLGEADRDLFFIRLTSLIKLLVRPNDRSGFFSHFVQGQKDAFWAKLEPKPDLQRTLNPVIRQTLGLEDLEFSSAFLLGLSQDPLLQFATDYLRAAPEQKTNFCDQLSLFILTESITSSIKKADREALKATLGPEIEQHVSLGSKLLYQHLTQLYPSTGPLAAKPWVLEAQTSSHENQSNFLKEFGLNLMGSFFNAIDCPPLLSLYNIYERLAVSPAHERASNQKPLSAQRGHLTLKSPHLQEILKFNQRKQII